MDKDQLLELKVYADASFDDPRQTPDLLAEMPNENIYAKRRDSLRSVPVEWRRAHDFICFWEPVLDEAQEVHQFRKYNYLKYRAVQHAKVNQLEKANADYATALDIRNDLVLANTRLVSALCRQSLRREWDLEEAVGVMSVELIKLVEDFDWRRKLRFSTMAVFVIERELRRYTRAVRVCSPRYVTYREGKSRESRKAYARKNGTKFAERHIMTEECMVEDLEDFLPSGPSGYEQEIVHEGLLELGRFILEDCGLDETKADMISKFFGMRGEAMSAPKIAAQYNKTKQNIQAHIQRGLREVEWRLSATLPSHLGPTLKEFVHGDHQVTS